MSVTNYRPISLLTTPGKILEKVVHTQMDSFLEEADLINVTQFGFVKIIRAIAQLLNHVDSNLNKKTLTVALYIDFKKAFDCLQYPILLQKFKSLHMAPDALGWIDDYLTDRKQSTCANGVTSPLSDVKQGVPQGSIMGPLLYIIYASEIPGYIKTSKVTLYSPLLK